MQMLVDINGKPLRSSDNKLIMKPSQTGLPGTPTFIFDVSGQSDLTANEYNSMQDSSGNGYNFAYVSGGKAVKSSALQLDGVDTLLTVNNGFNDGSLYRSAVGVEVVNQFFPTGAGTVMAVLAPKSFPHFFASVDGVVQAQSSNTFRPIGFANGTNYTRCASNTFSATDSIAPSTDTYYVITSRFDGSEIRGQLDNNTEFATSGDAKVALTSRCQFFFHTGDAGAFHGYVRWIVFWPVYLSNAEVAQAKAYFKAASPSLNV